MLKEKHLKLHLHSEQQHFDTIQFNFSFSPGSEVHTVYRLTVNEYNGVENVQLMIEHLMAPSDTPEQPDDNLRDSEHSIHNFHLRDALDLVSKKAPNLLLKFDNHPGKHHRS